MYEELCLLRRVFVPYVLKNCVAVVMNVVFGINNIIQKVSTICSFL